MRGEISLRVHCLMPERLLNRAVEQGARFARVSLPDSRTLLVDADPRSARALMALCRRFSVPASVERVGGGSAVRRWMKRRSTLLAGLVTCAALCALFLGRIWIVDVAFTGEAAALGDAAALRQAVFDAGQRPGADRAVDTEALARQLLARLENYSYVGVRRQGIRLLVEAAPEVPAPRVYDVEAPRDLVAAMDGIVVSASARSGALCVQPGDTVRRGQLLIRGEELSARDETRPIAALGEVVVRAWFSGEAALPTARRQVRDTGRRSTGGALRVANWAWPIARAGDYPSMRTETRALPIGGLFLPVEILRQTAIETEEVLAPVDGASLKARLAALAMADAARRLALYGPEDCAVKRTWIDCGTPSGGVMRARAVIEIHTNAAVTREYLLQGG